MFGFVADKYGRRAIFTFSLLFYCAATLIMAFQNTGFGVCLWRLIAGIGIGVELVTIDTYIAELVPKHVRGRAFAYNQVIQFAVVPVVALARLPAGADRAVRLGRLALGRADRLDRRAVRLVHPPRGAGKPALADPAGAPRPRPKPITARSRRRVRADLNGAAAAAAGDARRRARRSAGQLRRDLVAAIPHAAPSC